MLDVQMSNTHSPSDAAFAISHHSLDQHTSVVTPAGELDLTTAATLKWTLAELIESGHDRLVLDLSAVSFLDSTALGVLVGICKVLAPKGRLALACPHQSVLRTFQITGLDSRFELFETLDSAVDFARGDTAR